MIRIKYICDRWKLLLLALFPFSSFSQDLLNPIAENKSVVRSGNARFTVLTSQLIRLEWSSDGKFTDEASLVFINRKLPLPVFTQEKREGILTITTADLVLQFKIGIDSFSASNLSIRATKTTPVPFSWPPGQTDTLNLKGTMRTLDGVDEGNSGLLENGILSRSGWAVIDDSHSYLFDGDKDWNWVKDRSSSPKQDWYFFGYGHAYKKALGDYIKVAGKIPIPPRFAFGYWWSRYWIYSDRELREMVSNFKELDIPIDVMIIDMDWHETYNFRGNAAIPDGQGGIVGWTGYTWNNNLFPQPKKLLAWMEETHIKHALNLHPSSGIPPMEERYSAFAKAYKFDTTGRSYIPYYGSDKKWAKIYFDSILHPLEKNGVDFWWLDWQQYKFDKLKNNLSNTWWLNYLFFTDMQKQGKRPLLFHRWGGLGNHRYQIGFSGDTYITWKQLAFQPAFTSTASNVGYGYWSHDIGGHQPGDPSNNVLFQRWMQWGVFSPILRTHSTKKAVIDRRIWRMKEEFLTVRDLIRFRYSLNPYIYTAAYHAYQTGISLCRPMYYEYPEKEEAYNFPGQYQFGADMIVSPVTSPPDSITKLTSQKIWLPGGKWIEWFTGSEIVGGKIIERKFSPDEIPVYVRSGAIIPMFPNGIRNLQQGIDTLVLSVFGDTAGSTIIYEDDQRTEAYRKNEFATTQVESRVGQDKNRKIIVHPRQGKYNGMHDARAIEIRLPFNLPPSIVTVNGKKYEYSESFRQGHWSYRGMDLQTHIFIPLANCNKETVIEVNYDKAVVSSTIDLQNKVAIFKRMPKVMEMLKYESSRVDWGAALPDEVLFIEQTPTRIDYDPKNTIQYLHEMESALPRMLAALRNIKDVDPDTIENIIKYLP